jgi:quercetin dioxygenase-like cupin family protein
MNTPQPIVRTTILEAPVDLKPIDHVRGARIELAPGQGTGLHLHPAPVVGCIVKGEIEGQASRALHPGDAFFEPANTRILHFDNASAREGASFIAFYLLGPRENELIRMLPQNPPAGR